MSSTPGTLVVIGFTCWTASAWAAIHENGQNLNGQNLNGQNLNGQNLNGQNLNGVSLSGVTLAGESLANTHLEGSEIVAFQQETELRGEDLIGAQLVGDAGGLAVSLRIDDVTQGAGGNDDIYYYRVSYAAPSWTPLCGNGAAIAVSGRWDYRHGVEGGGSKIADSSAMTFACQGGAIAKCAEWGYKPWLGYDDHHQTCTRVVRADYCGDGESHTENGQLINLWDKVGVQSDGASWMGEASWGPNGARSYSLLNRSHLDLLYRLACGVNLLLLYSPSHEFSQGALIVTETPLSSDL